MTAMNDGPDAPAAEEKDETDASGPAVLPGGVVGDDGDDDDAALASNGWVELMGHDLMMKVLSMAPGGAEIQPGDAVRVGFVGCPAATPYDAWRRLAAGPWATAGRDGGIGGVGADASRKDDATGPSRSRRHRVRPVVLPPPDPDATAAVVAATATGTTPLPTGSVLAVVGDRDLPPCLELAVRFLRTGAVALVWSRAKYAYGPARRRMEPWPASAAAEGKDTADSGGDDSSDNSCSRGDDLLPANAAVGFFVTVLTALPEGERDLPETGLALAAAKKRLANDVYQREVQMVPPHGDDKDGAAGLAASRGRALYIYNSAVRYSERVLASLADDGGEDNWETDDCDGGSRRDLRFQAIHLLLDCLNNTAAVYLSAGDHKQAKAAAVRVLSRDPDNPRALVRAAKSSLADPASDFAETHAALAAAHQVLGGEGGGCGATRTDARYSDRDLALLRRDLQAVRAEFKQRQKDYKQETKVMMTRIGQALQSRPTIGSSDEEPKEAKRNQDPGSSNGRGISSDLDSEMETAFDDDLNANIAKLKQLKDSITDAYSDDETTTTRSSWKALIWQSLLQVILPLLTCWLFRYFQGAK